MRSLRFIGWAVSGILAVGAAGAVVGCGDSGDTGGAGGAVSSTGTKGVTTGAGMVTVATSTSGTQTTTSSTGSGMVTGDFTCLGVPLPTTAPAMIQLGGVTSSINGTMQGIEPGVTLSIFEGAAATPTAMTTSAADGKYLFMLATGGTPVDGYLLAKKTNFVDTYLYPPTPLFADTLNASPFIIATATLPLIAVLTGTQQMAGNALMAVIVSDCAQDPVAGSTVSISPAGSSKIIYTNTSGIPDTTATSTNTNGLAFILNAPAGSILVDAQAGPNNLREHTVNARPDVVTETIVAP